MVCERPPAAFGGSPPHGGENGVNLPLSRKKDRKSFVFDSPSSLLSWGRPTGLAGDTREGETRAKRARGSFTHHLISAAPRLNQDAAFAETSLSLLSSKALDRPRARIPLGSARTAISLSFAASLSGLPLISIQRSSRNPAV